jgi:hypothetical protein
MPRKCVLSPSHDSFLLTLVHLPTQFVGYYLAYTLPTAIFLICPVVLIIGRKRYIRSPPTGSVLAAALKLWALSMKGRWSLNPLTTYKNLKAPDFWDRAKPSQQEVKPAWMNFDDQWVDEVRRGFKACSVFLWFPIYCASFCPTVTPHCSYTPLRVDLQPIEQQLDVSSRHHGHERPTERRPV